MKGWLLGVFEAARRVLKPGGRVSAPEMVFVNAGALLSNPVARVEAYDVVNGLGGFEPELEGDFNRVRVLACAAANGMGFPVGLRLDYSTRWKPLIAGNCREVEEAVLRLVSEAFGSPASIVVYKLRGLKTWIDSGVLARDWDDKVAVSVYMDGPRVLGVLPQPHILSLARKYGDVIDSYDEWVRIAEAYRETFIPVTRLLGPVYREIIDASMRIMATAGVKTSLALVYAQTEDGKWVFMGPVAQNPPNPFLAPRRFVSFIRDVIRASRGDSGGGGGG